MRGVLRAYSAGFAHLFGRGVVASHGRVATPFAGATIGGIFRCVRRRHHALANPPQSAEALAQLATLPAGAPDALREYLHGDYLMLYTVADATTQANATVLSIRHHRQLSFDFARLWPGTSSPDKR